MHADLPDPDVSIPTTADPGARRSLRRRLAGGPVARAVGRADVRVYRTVRSAARPPRVVRVVRRFSRLGEHAAIWLALGLAAAALDPPQRAQWLRATRSVLVAYALNTLLKTVVRRKRPDLELSLIHI